nr:ribosomal protein S6 kinase alpha-5-like [Dermatophagoides farinae]
MNVINPSNILVAAIQKQPHHHHHHQEQNNQCLANKTLKSNESFQNCINCTNNNNKNNNNHPTTIKLAIRRSQQLKLPSTTTTTEKEKQNNLSNFLRNKQSRIDNNNDVDDVVDANSLINGSSQHHRHHQRKTRGKNIDLMMMMTNNNNNNNNNNIINNNNNIISNRKTTSVDMNDFDILKVLGTGAYGKVFLVRKIGGGPDNGKLYAMKVLKKSSVMQKQKTLEHTRTERQVLEVVRRRPFFVSLHYAFQTATKLHLILDYVNGGELFTHLYQRDYFTEDAVRIYAAELVLALENLHKLGIIYRDIKLENILLDHDGHIVLADFGLCKQFLPHETDQRTHSFCGTIEYMAPEIVGGNGHDFSVDWWSFGVLIYELLTGASPFTVDGERNTQQEISKRILRSQPPIPSHLSPEVRDLLQMILVKDPDRRLGGGNRDADEIKRHPFFVSIDWKALAERRVPAPFRPNIRDELDTSNFAEEFTRLVPNVSLLMGNDPPTTQNKHQQIADSNNNCDPNSEDDDDDQDDPFVDYSYIAPSLIIDQSSSSPSSSSSSLSSIRPPIYRLQSYQQPKHHQQQMSQTHRVHRPDIWKLVNECSDISGHNNGDKLNVSKTKNHEFFDHYELVGPGRRKQSHQQQQFSSSSTNQYKDLGWLGDGSYSICHRCRHRKTGEHFAVKIVSRHWRRDSETGLSYDAALNERSLLHACQGHGNIVQLNEVFQDDKYMFIVLELLPGGELSSRIRQSTNRRFNERQAWLVFRQLVSAVQYLHSRGIVHRDLKPENVLFKHTASETFDDDNDDEAEIKLVDFGFARFIPSSGYRMTTPCCTLNYAAPEVLFQAVIQSQNSMITSKRSWTTTRGSFANHLYRDGYDNSCDLWSLGAVLYTMLTGRVPFQQSYHHYQQQQHRNSLTQNSKKSTAVNNYASYILERILSGQELNHNTMWINSQVKISAQCKSVINGLLTINPKQRLTMQQLLKHPWINEMIVMDPSNMSPSCKTNKFSINEQKNMASAQTMTMMMMTNTSKHVSVESMETAPIISTQQQQQQQSQGHLKMTFKKKKTTTTATSSSSGSINTTNSIIDSNSIVFTQKTNNDNDDESAEFEVIDFSINSGSSSSSSTSSSSSSRRYDSGIHSLSSSSTGNGMNISVGSSGHQASSSSSSLSSTYSSSASISSNNNTVLADNNKVEAFLATLSPSSSTNSIKRSKRPRNNCNDDDDDDHSFGLMDRNNNNVESDNSDNDDQQKPSSTPPIRKKKSNQL